MTAREAINQASQHIARRDAETLLLHLLQRDRAWLLLHMEDALDDADVETLRQLASRRAAHEPLQHLTGVQEFFGLPLRVTRDTLIPRPETEHLVEAVLGWAKLQPVSLRLLDVGTGTGAIALALATHLPHTQITAVDLSIAALDVARANAATLGVADRITFLQSDLLDAFGAGQTFDAIVSNPPYIPITDALTLQPEVRDFEPALALFAGATGLDLYRRLIPAAHAALRKNGLLAMEFGFGQREALASLLTGSLPAAWHNVRFLDDYAGIPRIALAERA
jgi:release factor glutamine methyltransferase